MPLIRKDPPSSMQPSASAGLSSASADQRWTAARMLNAAGDVPALAAALEHEADRRVREAILTSLARIGTAECAAVAIPLVRSDNAATRTEALDALRAMPQAAADHLEALLGDPDPDVRLLATELARGAPLGNAIRWLCDVIDRETEPNVCAAAVEVLTEIGDASAVPSLTRCAERFRNEAFLAFAIKVALKRVQAGAAPA